jgi:hypothetical protein
VIGDGSHKPKRAKQSPIAPKGRNAKHKDWFFGIRFALLIVAWDVYRLPWPFASSCLKRLPIIARKMY